MEKILFETLNVSEEIKRAIRDMGFEMCIRDRNRRG